MRTYRRDTKTDVWCIEHQHRLRVKVKDLRATWLQMDDVERKNRAGRVRAFCPDPKCPEHHRRAFVGISKIPNFKEFVRDR